MQYDRLDEEERPGMHIRMEPGLPICDGPGTGTRHGGLNAVRRGRTDRAGCATGGPDGHARRTRSPPLENQVRDEQLQTHACDNGHPAPYADN